LARTVLPSASIIQIPSNGLCALLAIERHLNLHI
jgi:hypothetical protein